MAEPNTLISFNLSVSNKDFLKKSTLGFQIIPATTNYLTANIIANYKQGSNPNILIHTSYITRIFKQQFLLDNSKEEKIIYTYINLARKIGTKNILIHGPCNPTEYAVFGLCLGKLIQIQKNEDVVFHIEMPSFTKAFFEEYKVDIEFIINYFDIIANNKLKVVIDTAHAYANGMSTDDINLLLKTFEKKYDYIHLNGNCKPQFTHDKHTPLTFRDDKIKDGKKILDLLSSIKGKICICEVVFKDWKFWQNFVKDRELTLIDKDYFDNI